MVIIFISIIISIYLLVMFIRIVKKPTNVFVVEKGKIYQEEFTNGYIIRSEKIINTKSDKDIVPIKSECDKVAKGEAIYRYCVDNEQDINNKIKDLDIQIQELLALDESMPSSDVKVISNQIDNIITTIYEENDLNNINQKKNDIDSLLTKKMKIKAESSNSKDLKALVNKRNEYENLLINSSQYINAEESGVISYRVDGLEEKFKVDDFSYLSEDYLNNVNVETSQIIAMDTNNGKIVNNFVCYVAAVLDSKEALESEIGKTVKLRLQSSEETTAKIAYKKNQNNNKVLIVFELENNVEDLIQYRRITMDVVWWSDSGIKVPNSAIKYEGDIAYVIRNRSGLKEKIYIKILRQNEKYSVVENYTYAELKEAGYDNTQLINKKSISVYDEIEN